MKHDDHFTKTGSGYTRGNISASIEEQRVCLVWFLYLFSLLVFFVAQSAEIRFDHNTLLSRRSFIGQHWHSHNYVEDNFGATTTPGGARLKLCRSLIYPDGFKAYNDGGLKVVPGAHLYRSRDLQDSTVPYECVSINTLPAPSNESIYR
jgi:hypothetical protein